MIVLKLAMIPEQVHEVRVSGCSMTAIARACRPQTLVIGCDSDMRIVLLLVACTAFDSMPCTTQGMGAKLLIHKLQELFFYLDKEARTVYKEESMTGMAPRPNRVTKGATSRALYAPEVLLFKIVEVLFMVCPLATPGGADEVELADTTAGPFASSACIVALKAPVKPVIENLSSGTRIMFSFQGGYT